MSTVASCPSTRLRHMPMDYLTQDIASRFKEVADVLEQMPVGVAIAAAPSGKLLFHNAEAIRLLGHPMFAADACAEYVQYGAIHPDGTPYRPDEYPIARALQGICVPQEEMHYIRGDGSRTCFLVNALPMRDSNGNVLKAISVFFDIAEKKKADAHVEEIETKLRLAVSIAGIGFWEWNVEDNSIYFSPEWKKQLGYGDQEIPNRYDEWETRVHAGDLHRVNDRLRQYLEHPEGDYQVVFRMRHRDGSYRWIEARAQLVMDAQGRPMRMIGTHLDISEHKQREEAVRQAGQHDRLTGLPNRALLLEQAERWLSAARRTGKQFAVLFIDLDEFKPINDTHGHHIGDLVLQEVAQRLRASFRSHDIVSRLGGDEFVAVVTQLDGELGAAHAAAHALRQLSLPYQVGGLTLHTSPSIGVSLFPRNGSDMETLLRHADTAMYDAKQHGKAAFRFYQQNDCDPADAAQLELGLRKSFAQGCLQLHYQPIVDASAHRVAAAEALLRWPGAGGQGIPPDVFIPVAEQSGFILELGNWVLEEACQQQRRWCALGLPPIDIGVNLSAVQFRSAELGAAISRGVAGAGIDPRSLWLEISDRSFTGRLDHAMDALAQLKSLGVRVTLDDFGAGYSSLEQLSRLPIDRIKIDRSLIAALPGNRSSVAVTEAAIAYGNALGIDVVAEGLETQQILGFLQQRRCRTMQGHYYAPAMSGARFAQWYGDAGLH